MPSPFEFLLGVEQSREVDRSLLVGKQLRRGDAERVDGGKSWRHSLRRIGANRSRKGGRAIRVDFEIHRRISLPGDTCHGEQTSSW